MRKNRCYRVEELKNFRYLVIAIALIAVLLGTAIIGTSVLQKRETESDVLFQISTIDALSVGVYDGNLTFKELSEHGDTGIGIIIAAAALLLRKNLRRKP